MWTWLSENAVTVVTLAALALVLALAVRSLVKQRKSGGCTGDCASCPGCRRCGS